MSFATYAAGGVLLCAFLGALTNQHYSWCALGGAAFGAWLPHLCERHWLIHRIGSQTLTHSLLGLLVCAFLMSPLLACHQAAFWTALLIGYASHLLLDAASDRGVLLFYPSRVRAVLPRHPLSRIPPGSPREVRLRFWLLGLLIAALPLNALGVRGLLHQLLPVVQFAVEDYETISGQGHRVLADFTGHFTVSQRSVSGRWEAIHAPTDTTLLLIDPSGRIYRIGNHPADTIRPLTIRSHRGEPVRVEVQEIALKHQPLGILLKSLPQDADIFLTGWAILEEPVALNYSQEEFPTITLSDRKLEFPHAPISELTRQRLLTIEVLRAHILVRSISSAHPIKEGGRSHG